MTVLVCGDRNWDDYSKVKARLRALPPDTIIVEGGCRGADMMAHAAAIVFGFQVRVYPALWEQFGKRAGPVRNELMLQKEHPDLVIAFHSDLVNSRGTKDMVQRARKAGIATEIIS